MTDFASHDLHHLLANVSTLRALGIGCLLYLVGLTLCETDAEHTKVEAIGRLHIYMGLN